MQQYAKSDSYHTNTTVPVVTPVELNSEAHIYRKYIFTASYAKSVIKTEVS